MSRNRWKASLLSSAVFWLLGVVFMVLGLTARANGGVIHLTTWFRSHDIVTS
jgi:hypothetical protein